MGILIVHYLPHDVAIVTHYTHTVAMTTHTHGVYNRYPICCIYQCRKVCPLDTISSSNITSSSSSSSHISVPYNIERCELLDLFTCTQAYKETHTNTYRQRHIYRQTDSHIYTHIHTQIRTHIHINTYTQA